MLTMLQDAIRAMIREFGAGTFAIVMDSYDYVRALTQVLPSISSYKTDRGGFMVLRPDSGDPTEVVLQALRASEKVFGATVNDKGYKVITGAGVIQGDGINLTNIYAILTAVLDEGYSAQSVAFGMGGGLLQKVNRDTMSFATKLSFIKYADGHERNIMKAPKTDASKVSLPGELAVVYSAEGVPMVYPKGAVDPAKNALRVIYDKGPVKGTPQRIRRLFDAKLCAVDFKWDTFDEVRKRVEAQFATLPASANVVTPELQKLIVETREQQIAASDKALEGVVGIEL